MIQMYVAIVMAVGALAGTRPSAGFEFGLHCLACKDEFTMKREELPKIDPSSSDGMEMMGAGMALYDCKLCNKKKCAIMMDNCPKCKKPYITEAKIKQVKEFIKSKRRVLPAAMGQSDVICPNCGLDINKWYREQYRK